MKILTRVCMVLLLAGILVACSSGESNESGATNKDNEDGNAETSEESNEQNADDDNGNQDSGDSGMDGERYEIVGDDVYTDFEEDRYDGLEIELISAGYVPQLTDELYDRYPIPDSYGAMLLEVEITNTTDDLIYFYEFALTSEPVEDWDDDEEFNDKFIGQSESIFLEDPDYDMDAFKEQLDFLSKYKLLANAEHEYLPNSSERGIHLISFKEDDIQKTVAIHNTTLGAGHMFDLEQTGDAWNFSNVEYDVDYENHEEKLEEYQ